MPTRIDPEERLAGLLDEFEPRVKQQFLGMVNAIQSRLDLGVLERLLQNGQIEEAIGLVRSEFVRFATATTVVFTGAGEDTAEFLRGLRLSVSFDAANTRAVAAIQRRQARLVTALTQQARASVVSALLDGTGRGLNPRAQARLFRASIGLTDGQERWVQNYRRQLAAGDLGALDRQRRDRRFDRTVRRAAQSGRPLSPTEIERMVTRYRQRLVIYRSETIARTEALRGVHEGTNEMYQQAFEDGSLDPESVSQIWNTSGDARVRDSHTTMQGQQIPVGESFVSGMGNRLEYPGDPNAPAHEVIQCRCVVSRRLESL